MSKIVFESLNEVLSFERGGDPLSALGIGYKKKIEDWLNEMDIENYIINDNLTIDSNSIIILDYKNLIELPEYIQFNHVNNFTCSFNDLISLRGCPKYVNENFWCNTNNLANLKDCPKYVGENFFCFGNKIKFTKEDVRKLCKVKGKIVV